MQINEEEVIAQEEVIEEVELEDEQEDVEEESVEELKKKLATTIAQKEHWRTKANSVKEVSVETNSTLSSADLLAVMKADVHEDDMERVEKFAKMEGVTIREALKNPELKAMLDLRAEQRNVANATNVSNARRGSVKVTDDVLLSKAESGNLPEDDDGIARLIAAKLKRK